VTVLSDRIPTISSMAKEVGSQAAPTSSRANGAAKVPPSSSVAATAPKEEGQTATVRPSVVARQRPWARRWLVVLPLVGLLLLGGTAFAVNRVAAPSYTAQALLAVLPNDPATTVSVPVSGIWAQVGQSDVLLSQAAQTLDVDQQTLASSVSLAQGTDSPVITVSVTTNDPRRSARWANAVAKQIITQSTQSPVPGYGVRQVAQAIPPVTRTTPVSPTLVLTAAVLGALAGLVLAQRLARRRRLAGAP
jgi:capsular polysaccharide biosynthesis protein